MINHRRIATYYRRRERLVSIFLLSVTAVASTGILLIVLFLLLEGWPALRFVLEGAWDPEQGNFGLLPMLWGSLAITLGALLLSVPIGVGFALFLTEVAPPKTGAVLRAFMQSLSGVPSVVYGFIGLTLLVPAIRSSLGGPGFSLLAGAVVLGVMILPTISAVAEEALRTLPADYREGAAALGATPWQTVYCLLLPAARSGLVTATVLGFGRALGETMAALMVTGNVAIPPTSLLAPVRTLTGNIALEMSYATGRHRAALFATGALLLALVLTINSLARRIGR